MRKNSKIFFVPTIPKHIRLSDFDTELTVDEFEALLEISRQKGKVTKKDFDELVKSQKTSAAS